MVAFRKRRFVRGNKSLFPAMDHFMAHLRDKTWRSRRVAVIENGSWAPAAAKVMRGYLEAMKDVSICETVHTIQGRHRSMVMTLAHPFFSRISAIFLAAWAVLPWMEA